MKQGSLKLDPCIWNEGLITLAHILNDGGAWPPQTRGALALTFLQRPLTMSDDADYAIESADAGASTTIPMEAGQIKKGG